MICQIEPKDLWNQIVKKTVAYLLPWAVWSFAIRGIIFNQKHFLDIKYLLWHMDTGYWFLFSIWTITMIFTVATYFAHKSERLGIFIKSAIYFFGMVLLAGIGYIYGMSFLCIKLTLYYMPFYFIGYLYTEIEKLLSDKKWFEQAKEIVVVVCLAIWLLIIIRVNIYNLDESLVNIALRAFSSLTGCIAVAGLISSLPINRGGYRLYRESLFGSIHDTLPTVEYNSCFTNSEHGILAGDSSADAKLCINDCNFSGINKNDELQHGFETISIWEKIKVCLFWAGKNSLQIYLLHGFLLNILYYAKSPSFQTPMGILITFGNFIITIILIAIIVHLMEQNKLLQFVLFGKKINRRK